MIERLNQQLLDTIDLASQTKLAQRNVEGPQFFPLHELFDRLAAELNEQIDELAERATALGGTARGTVRQAAARSRLSEFPEDAGSGQEHLQALVERFAALADFGPRSDSEAFQLVAATGDSRVRSGRPQAN